MEFEVKVLLFGQSGVGKTSLLAAIFNAIQNLPTFDKFTAQSLQSHDLDRALAELKRYVRSLEEGRPVGITKTSVPKPFEIVIGLHGFGHTVKLMIQDMPGESLDDPKQKAEWINKMKESDIIIHAIATPAMMELDRRYNGDINKPDRFREYFDKALGVSGTVDQPIPSRKIFLVPVKCEKYLDDGPKLEEAVTTVYHNLRTSIRTLQHFCYFLPVQTLGSVVFDRFELDERKRPVDHYRIKAGAVPEWQPVGHDMLAAHLLDHCLWMLEANFPDQVRKDCAAIRAKLQSHCTARVLEQPDKPIPRKLEACFSGGTLVRTRDHGQVAIATVRPGTWVLTQNHAGGLEWQEVVRVTQHLAVPLIRIEIGARELWVTSGHLFRTPAGWQCAGQLDVGDLVICVDPSTGNSRLQPVASRSEEQRCAVAYNLYTRKNGNYVAEGVVVSSFAVLNGLRRLRMLLAHAFSTTARRRDDHVA